MFRFEKLQVWQTAIEFASDVYTTTSKFPVDERFGLTSQMRRASVSVSSNVAEGRSRSSDSDFARFVEIGYGSLMEVISEASIARRQSMISADSFQKLYRSAEEIARMLSGLRATLVAQSRVAR